MGRARRRTSSAPAPARADPNLDSGCEKGGHLAALLLALNRAPPQSWGTKVCVVKLKYLQVVKLICVSQEGGDNHFVSARERDLKPLLEAGLAEFDLGVEKANALEAFLETAWLAGTRSGHAKMLNHAIRQREEHSDEDWEAPIEAARPEDLEAEFKAMMEASAEVLSLSVARTIALWDLLSRAWAAGVQTYESEVMASLIERRSDIADEAQRWLEGGERED